MGAGELETQSCWFWEPAATIFWPFSRTCARP